MSDVTATLQSILADHDVVTSLESDGWLSTCGNFPACRAYTSEPHFRDRGCKLRLDVEVAISANRVIIESFSDFGSDIDSAFHSSLQNFCTETLHALLSGLWGRSDPDQVLVERWQLGGQSWALHIGNMVRKAAGGVDVPPPNDLMGIFAQCIEHRKYTSRAHWGRLYFANVPNTDSTIEVLQDNEPWPEAQQKLRGASWPIHDFFYSNRMFWLMITA